MRKLLTRYTIIAVSLILMQNFSPDKGRLTVLGGILPGVAGKVLDLAAISFDVSRITLVCIRDVKLIPKAIKLL